MDCAPHLQSHTSPHLCREPMVHLQWHFISRESKMGPYFLNGTLRLPISYTHRQVRGAGAVHKSVRWTGGHSRRSTRQRMDGCPG
jgi:hypothetical protein